MIKLVWTKNNIIKEVFHINSITQELKYKQWIVKNALRNGVTVTSIVYKKHRKCDIYLTNIQVKNKR